MVKRNLDMATILFMLSGFPALWNSSFYLTYSRREDVEAKLLAQAKTHFAPLPRAWGTSEFPTSPERVALGRMLFFDPRLTIEGNVSCATCHQPAFYGTDALPKSIGVQHRQHFRNAPSTLNAALNIAEHWRGDRKNLEDQALQALTSPISSGHTDSAAVIAKVRAIKGYAPLFAKAFPKSPNVMTADNLAVAIGAYERTLATPAPFDAFLRGDTQALSPAAKAGLHKFMTLGCSGCHSGAGVGGGTYQKFGVVEDYWKGTGSHEIDKGRFDVTKNPADMYVFRVPSLRNVAMTAPYFHDGSVQRLPDAVRIMGRVQLGVTLTEDDTQEIESFLESLTGELPPDFRNVPVLPGGAFPRQE
jgi:cytochrome c peroxidase